MLRLLDRSVAFPEFRRSLHQLKVVDYHQSYALLLDKLLEGGYITPAEYISRLPAGVIGDRQSLIDRLNTALNEEKENIA